MKTYNFFQTNLSEKEVYEWLNIMDFVWFRIVYMYSASGNNVYMIFGDVKGGDVK